MEEIRILAPTSIANISCGFDILGLCLETFADELLVRKVQKPGIRITKIRGQNLPLEIEKNVAGVAGLALLKNLGISVGFEIEMYKKIKPGSGLGSSAASAAGVVFAINELLGKPFTANELIYFAMQGEKLASGSAHADNVAPALLGGFTVIKSYEPLEVLKINAPPELFATVIHPNIEIKTSEARAVIKKQVSLKKMIRQMGNLTGLISGLYTSDYDLIGRSLHDEIIEPYRSGFIPEFSTIKANALESGALGAGISGSGPSIFALSRGKETAEKVGKVMAETYDHTSIMYDVYVSKINKEGLRVIR